MIYYNLYAADPHIISHPHVSALELSGAPQVAKPLSLGRFYPHAPQYHVWSFLSSTAPILDSDEMEKMGIITPLFYQEGN